MVTTTCFSGCLLKCDNQDQVDVACGGLVGVAFITSSSWEERLSVGGCGLALQAFSLTVIFVGWLTVADVRPGPLT